jgi:hypothetical protein
MWRIIGFGVTVAVACLLAAASAAQACSMAPGWQPPSADARVAAAALAVIGTVSDVEAPGPGVPAASYAFTFTVERVVKGATEVSQVRLRTYRGGALCLGFEARPGEVLGLAVDGLAEDQVVTVFSLFDPQALGRDPDLDNVDASSDNCPNVANPGQEDADGDGIGNVCEPAAPPNQPVATPRSTVTVPTARARRPLLRGTATVEHGDGATVLAAVRVSVVRTTGRRCRALTAGGRWTRDRKQDGRCTPRFLLAARGLGRWTLRLPAELPRGRYVVSSSARLANGVVEAPGAANRAVVRVPRR